MKNKFIYVFDVDMRDKLLSENYQLLKSDERQDCFIFENKGTLVFDLGDSKDTKFIYSDILTF